MYIEKDKEKQSNYYLKEQKVYSYAKEFFREICRCNISMVSDWILPLICRNKVDTVINALENGENAVSYAGFRAFGKRQAVIFIDIDGDSSVLSKNLKQSVRHEIIHYYLWLMDLPFADDSLEFWCLCHVFDGAAYAKMEESDVEKYELFKSVYEEYCMTLPENIKYIVLGNMISQIGMLSQDEFENEIINIIQQLKKVFRIS